MKKRQQRHAVMKIGAVTRGLTSRNTADLRTSPGMRGSLDGGLEKKNNDVVGAELGAANDAWRLRRQRAGSTSLSVVRPLIWPRKDGGLAAKDQAKLLLSLFALILAHVCIPCSQKLCS
ncbi:hypothetical protein NL676_000839 [Syzygium grande]|nr:hypothetical protein NL676_000839 [Syzygium grande]